MGRHTVPSVTTEPTHLPLPLESDWLDWVGARGEQQLALARSLVEGLRSDPPREPLEVLRVWNDAQTALSNAASVGSLFSEVHPDEAVRERAESVAQQVQKLDTDLGLDTRLYAVLAGLDASGLDTDAARVLERTLRDFRRSGVDRDEATRDRLRELSERAILLSQEFSKNIRENVRSIRVSPGPAGRHARRTGSTPHPVDDDGLVTVTTDYPDVVPFRTFARDAQARARPRDGVPHHRLAGERPRAAGDLRRAPGARRVCSATRPGPTTTPRSR